MLILLALVVAGLSEDEDSGVADGGSAVPTDSLAIEDDVSDELDSLEDDDATDDVSCSGSKGLLCGCGGTR